MSLLLLAESIKRWIVRVTMAVLLILCVGSGWMAIRSYREPDQLRLARWSNTMVAADAVEWRAWYGTIRSSRGKVALMSLRIEGRWKEVREEVLKDSDGKTRYEWMWGDGIEFKREPEWMMVPKNYSNRVEFAGFSYGRFERQGGYYIGRAINEASVIRLVLVPWPAVVVMLGIGPVGWGLRKVFKWRKRKRRISTGLCGECGYDLRGSAGKCPECGRAPGQTVRGAHPTPETPGGVK